MFKKISVNKSLLVPALFLAAGIFLLFSFVKADGQPSIVSVSDLSAAGFYSPQALTVSNGRYLGPNSYFSVSDNLNNANEPDQVMVDYMKLPYTPSQGALFSYGSDSHSLQISGGQGKEATIADGRTAVNFIKGNNYVVVIGPESTKVESLAKSLASKIQ